MKNKLIMFLAVLMLTLSNGLYAQDNLFDTPWQAYGVVIECLNGKGLCEGKSDDEIIRLIKKTITKNGKLKKGYEKIFTYSNDRREYIFPKIFDLENKDLLKKLLEFFVNLIPDKDEYIINEKKYGFCNNNLLHLVSENGYTETVKLLIEKGADVNAKNYWDKTSLHLASEDGHTETVRLLIEKGADVNAKNYKGKTPLHLALYKGHPKTAELLIEKKADINAQDKYKQTPLHLASKNGHTETVRLLIEKGADIEAKDSGDWTPLARAAYKANKDVVHLLLNYGANPNVIFKIFKSYHRNQYKEVSILENVAYRIKYYKSFIPTDNASERAEDKTKINDSLYIQALIGYMSDPHNRLKRMKCYRQILTNNKKTKALKVLNAKIKELEQKVQEQDKNTSLNKTSDKLKDYSPVNIFASMS